MRGLDLSGGWRDGSGSNFEGANLTGANLSGIDLSDVDLLVVTSANVTVDANTTLPSGWTVVGGALTPVN